MHICEDHLEQLYGPYVHGRILRPMISVVDLMVKTINQNGDIAEEPQWRAKQQIHWLWNSVQAQLFEKIRPSTQNVEFTLTVGTEPMCLVVGQGLWVEMKGCPQSLWKPKFHIVFTFYNHKPRWSLLYKGQKCFWLVDNNELSSVHPWWIPIGFSYMWNMQRILELFLLTMGSWGVLEMTAVLSAQRHIHIDFPVIIVLVVLEALLGTIIHNQDYDNR